MMFPALGTDEKWSRIGSVFLPAHFGENQDFASYFGEAVFYITIISVSFRLRVAQLVSEVASVRS